MIDYQLIRFQYIGLTGVILVLVTIIMQVSMSYYVGKITYKINEALNRPGLLTSDEWEGERLGEIVALMNKMRSWSWRLTGILFGILVILAIINEVIWVN